MRGRLTMRDIRKNLKKYSKLELAEIWNNLIVYIWDDRIGEKPEDYDYIITHSFNKYYSLPTKAKYVRPYCKAIESIIGEKECLKYFHVNIEGKTSQQFQLYWIKRTICKFLHIGMYNKKNMGALITILREEYEKAQQKEFNQRWGG